MVALLRAMKRDLHDEMTTQRHEFQTGLADLRRTMEHGFARIDGRLDVLEQRTYDQKPGPATQTG